VAVGTILGSCSTAGFGTTGVTT